jgi:hypothetical protein
MYYLRNKYIIISEEEYNKLQKVEGGYKLMLEKTDLNDHIEEIYELIIEGKSRPSICNMFQVTPTEFDNFLEKNLGSRKITDCKIILIKRAVNKV